MCIDKGKQLNGNSLLSADCTHPQPYHFSHLVASGAYGFSQLTALPGLLLLSKANLPRILTESLLCCQLSRQLSSVSMVPSLLSTQQPFLQLRSLNKVAVGEDLSNMQYFKCSKDFTTACWANSAELVGENMQIGGDFSSLETNTGVFSHSLD